MNRCVFWGLVVILGAACGSNDEEGASAQASSETMTAEIEISGAENDSSSTDLERVIQEEVLAVVEAGGETYTFLRLGEGEDASLGMTVDGHGGNGSQFQGLLDREGDLTLLEIFRAIAPDREPPEALLESHPLEVAAMNRGEARVRSVEKTVPPPGVDVCSLTLFFPSNLVWTNKLIVAAGSGGNSYLCVSNSFETDEGQPTSSSCTFTSTLRMMAGVCNLNTTTIQTYSGSGTATTWINSTTRNLPGNEYRIYSFAASNTARRLAAVALSPFGAGFGYGLRSGTAQ